MLVINIIKNRMEIIAHRGASAYALENSRQALELAWRMGADRVELDVRAARDGTPLILHDATLNRTTTGSGVVSRFDWKELSKLRLKNGEPLLSLEEALDFLRGKAGVYLDVKDPRAVTAIAAEVRKFGDVIVGSTNPSVLRRVKAKVPEAPTSLLVSALNNPVGKAVSAGANYIHLCWEHIADPVVLVSTMVLREAKAAGVEVILWHEERPEELTKIAQLKDVFGVCTNTPDLARQILGGIP